MALLGGGVGGAGNPVGGSFTGASLGLEYVLDRCYAYSGTQDPSNAEQTLLEFKTGNKLIVGSLTCVGPVPNNGAGVASGGISAFTLTFNGGEITRMKVDTLQEDQAAQQTVPLVIPSYTEVKLVVLSNVTSADNGLTSAIVVGQTFQTAD